MALATLEELRPAHAILGASGAHIWGVCTPSAVEGVRANLPDPQTDYRERGTLGHAIVQQKLKAKLDDGEDGVPPDYDVATWKTHRLWDQELEDHTDVCVDYAMERIAYAKLMDASAKVFVERTVELSKWIPGAFGTADLMLVYGNTLEVADWKFGQGILVEAEGNWQIRIYGLGALLQYDGFWDIANVTLSIVQPARDSIKREILTKAELSTWADEVLVPAARLAAQGLGPYVPGPHCGFCKIAPVCRARADAATTVLDTLEPGPIESGRYTIAQLAANLQKYRQALAWAGDVQEFLTARALEGAEVPGYVLVDGRKSYTIKDIPALVEKLGKEGVPEAMLYDRKLVGFTEMKNRIGSRLYKTVVEPERVPNPPKKTLVPADDPRANKPKGHAAAVFTDHTQPANQPTGEPDANAQPA